MRFVVDVMLGRLAKWLRILGYDTFYDPSARDEELLKRVEEEKRILLTRDTRLAARLKSDRCLLIESQNAKEQLRQVVQAFGLDASNYLLSICTRCNEKVESVNKSAVKGKVPGYVFANHDEFVQCGRCGRIYWSGSHFQEVQRWIQESLEIKGNAEQERNR